MSLPVSVVIPTYNRAALIGETLDSILSQTHPVAEVVVVDDGSTDNTADVVRRYGSKVRLVRIENSGVCRARNVGIEEARSEWIALCDSDDLWLPDKLELQAELLGKATDVEYCFVNFRIVRDGQWSKTDKFADAPEAYWDVRRREVTPDSFVIEEPFYRRVVTFQPIFQSNIVFSKSFFRRVGGYDESFGRQMSEDFEFTLRCVQESPIGVVTKPAVGIRWHGANFSSGSLGGVSFVLGDIRILKHSMTRHRLGPEHAGLLRSQIVRRSAAVARSAFSVNEFGIVRQALKDVPVSAYSAHLALISAVARLPAPVARAARRGLRRLKGLAGG